MCAPVRKLKHLCLLIVATISVHSGKGGDGAVSFRREKFVPRGGPDGGDGGRGGDVILVAEHRMHTLLRFRYERHFTAEAGGSGSGNNRHGKNAKDMHREGAGRHGRV